MKEYLQLIGREGDLAIDGLQVRVTVLDIKQAYGNTRYVVTPVSGSNRITVDSSRVSLDNS